MSLQLPAWPPDWPELETAAILAIRSGDWGRYRSTSREELRSAIKERFGVPHVRLCSSGTAAIELGLRAAGIGHGDEVILAAFDYPGNFRCVELLGARPVLVDTAPGKVVMDSDQVEIAASDSTKAVVASHLHGQAAPVRELRELCERNGWFFLEDACQVPGMEVERIPAGGWGVAATLSFGGSKTLTSGSGGALLTSDAKIAARLGPLADRPSDAYPLGPLQAALLLPQLARLDQLNQQRAATVQYLLRHAKQHLPAWHPIDSLERVGFAHYKMAWYAVDATHRQRIIAAAAEHQFPIGAGFRATHKISSRRCRKPSDLPQSQQLSDTLFVLDHTALMLTPEHHPQLLHYLTQIHNQST